MKEIISYILFIVTSISYFECRGREKDAIQQNNFCIDSPSVKIDVNIIAKDSTSISNYLINKEGVIVGSYKFLINDEYPERNLTYEVNFLGSTFEISSSDIIVKLTHDGKQLLTFNHSGFRIPCYLSIYNDKGMKIHQSEEYAENIPNGPFVLSNEGYYYISLCQFDSVKYLSYTPYGHGKSWKLKCNESEQYVIIPSPKGSRVLYSELEEIKQEKTDSIYEEESNSYIYIGRVKRDVKNYLIEGPSYLVRKDIQVENLNLQNSMFISENEFFTYDSKKGAWFLGNFNDKFNISNKGVINGIDFDCMKKIKLLSYPDKNSILILGVDWDKSDQISIAIVNLNTEESRFASFQLPTKLNLNFEEALITRTGDLIVPIDNGLLLIKLDSR